MAEDGVRVEGVDELERGVADLADEVARAVPHAAEGPAGRLVERVRAQAPRISGAMVGSLAVQTIDGNTAAGYDGSVEYVGWVEFGGTRGRPYVSDGRYLFPEANNSEAELVDALGQMTSDEIGRFRWPSP